MAKRFRESLAAISLASPSQARAMLDSYFTHLSPAVAHRADQFFPRTVRRHPMDSEKTREASGKFFVLYFHVGNAILGYYDAVKASNHPQEEFEQALGVFDRRVKLMEGIAEAGLDKYRIDGTEGKGVSLVRKVAEKPNVPDQTSK